MKREYILYADGFHDDTEVLRLFADVFGIIPRPERYRIVVTAERTEH